MKKFKTIACTAFLGLSLVSCNDFLTLIPLNDVVLENFWTDKADVESVLLGAYAQLESSDCITRMSIWGEMRSDNIIAGSSTANDILQITRDNILETNGLTSWLCFYDVINRCNTVMNFAPMVQDKDPNYTYAELKANLAEAIALRSLCYFYLIRAYRDVPYITRPSIDDTENFVVPATKFDVILQNLIDDLEVVKEDAVNKYVKEEENSSRITRVAIYSMLADLYLWQGDWDNCILNCDKVLSRKLLEYEKIKIEKGPDCVIRLYKGIPLIQSMTENGRYAGTSYNEIFGKGNSFESIFELAFMDAQSVNNSFISTYYGSKNTQVGQLAANSELFLGVAGGTNKLFKKTDGRYLESMKESSSQYGIVKYIPMSIEYNLLTSSASAPKATVVDRSDQQISNWIVYRLTDVMLMKAEAKVMKSKVYEGSLNADSSAIKELLFQEAFKIVGAVNDRSTNKEGTSDTLKYSTYSSSVKAMEELVLDERRRELLFEGKRWFDLVRMSRRDGDSKRLVQYVITKYTENVSAVRIKLADMNSLYFPISKDELRINTELKQNPAYEEDDYISKSE